MKKKDGIEAIIAYYEENMPQNVILVKNHKRYDEVKQAIQDIADFVWDTDESAQINVNPDDLTGSSICVEIIASLVVIDMIDKFCNALRKANNFEVYPREDGNIGLGIVFEGVYDPAPPKK